MMIVRKISIWQNSLEPKKVRKSYYEYISFVVSHPFSFFFSFLIWCYNLYIKNTTILYYRSIFPVSVYCPFSYFVFILFSNLYNIFISVLKVVFFFFFFFKFYICKGSSGKRISVRHNFFLYLWGYEFIIIGENIQ